MNRLYHVPLSPFCRKVRLTLAEKRIEVELVEERYWEQGQEFLRRNPAGKVPIVKLDGKMLSESQAICEYLEEIVPNPPLFPRDVEGRYEVRRLCAWFDDKFNHEVTTKIMGERLGGLLPYFIFILCLQGAMAPASDLGAGEKERGTLETLLISPMDRYKLVLGKFLTIGIAGLITALITVSSMAIWGIVLSQGMAIEFVAEVMAMIGIIDFVLIFLMLIPVVAIFAAVLLSLSIYARSFKEAQSYMGALIMVVIFPVLIAMMPGVKLEGGWIWVPLTNVALAMKELFKGTMDYFALFGIFTSTVAIAAALIAFCVYWFNKEKVLFR